MDTSTGFSGLRISYKHKVHSSGRSGFAYVASDAARFSHAQASNTLYLGSELFSLVGAPLSALGTRVVAANGDDMGGFQAIQVMPNGIYRGASDHRKDGAAVGW